MGDTEVINILLENADVLTPSNIFYFILRFLGWGVIKLLEFLLNSAEGVLDEIMKFLNFFDSSIVNNIIDKIKPIAIVLLTLSIMYIGYQIMINRKKYDISRVPTNIIISILIIFFLPTAMSSLGDLTKEGFDLFKSENTMIANEIIANNISDLYLYDKSNFSNKNIEPKNTIDRNKITKIDPTEEIDRSKVKNKEVFENKVVPAIGKEGYELKKINGWFKIDSEYYRWDINFFQIITMLLISSLVLIFTMIKIVKLMFELAFSKIFIIGGAFADLSYGQKTKQILMHIISIYIAIISVGLTLQLYILGTAWLNDRVSGFASIMINLGSALFVIDGPNLLEKIFGVDAGLSSGLRVLMGINSGLDIAQKLGNGVKNIADVAQKGLGAGAVIGAGAMGFKKGMIPDIENDMNNKENPFSSINDINGINGNSNMLLGENNDESGVENSDIPISPINPSGDIDSSNIDDDLSVMDNESSQSLNNDLLDNNSLSDISDKDIQSLNDDIDSVSFGNGFDTIKDNINDDIGNVSHGSGSLNDDIGNVNSAGGNDFKFDSSQLNSSDIGKMKFTDSLSNDNELGNNKSNSGALDKRNINTNWQYGNSEGRNSGERINLGFTPKWRDGVYNEPNYIDSNETRNIKDMLQGAMNKKINNVKNSDLANKMSTSYKIGNNTAKDLKRYIGIKEVQLQDKIVETKLKRDMRGDKK